VAAPRRLTLPRPLRRAAGRARATLVRQDVLGSVHRIVRSGRPIIAGPWLGEVGFEILYWIPFLRWLVAEFDIDPRRVVAVSRGGPSSWYRDVSTRYIDIFDHVTIDRFRDGNERRRHELGEQKQVRPAAFDRDILECVQRAESLMDAECLHPSLMYRLFQPYWWKHAGVAWVHAHQRLASMPVPGLPAALAAGPGTYIAAKFYFNDCVEDTSEVRRFAAELLDRLSGVAPVISLSTPLALDDHAGASEEARGSVTSIASIVNPRNNLFVQTAVVANARAFVGTYGGFSYLAPLHGVPTVSVFSKAGGFDPAHLTVARDAFTRLAAPAFDVEDLNRVSPSAIVSRVAALLG
jgi:hypothetical protein